MEILDETNLKILKLLQDNARISAKEIAEKVFISAPTVASRIESMKNAGIITGFYTRINSSFFGNHLKAYIEMEVAPQKKEELYELIKKSTQVVECSRVTGNYSLLMQVFFKDTEDLDHFINKLQLYGRTKTQIVFSDIVEPRGTIIDLQ